MTEDATRRAPDVAVAAVAAGLGSLLAVLVLSASWTTWVPGGLLFGATFGVVVGRRVRGVGSGLIWGLGAAFLAWMLVPVGAALVYGGFVHVSVARPLSTLFRWLPAFLLGLGAPAGLGVGLVREWREPDGGTRSLSRILFAGGLGGLAGGWAFGAWLSANDVYGAIAGIVDSSAVSTGRLVHLGIAVLIGLMFAALFQRDVLGSGSSLAWGMTFGIFWWFLGALTLFPLLTGSEVQWDATRARAGLGSLVGHAVYGLVLGLTYAAADRIWLMLFVESDPLHHEVEGPGVRLLQSMGWGLLASVSGGLLFALVLYHTGELETIARLAGGQSRTFGFFVHMTISAIIGLTFGPLFQYESPDHGAGVAWGMVYGVVWWLLGPLTVLPALLGRPIQWDAETLAATWPSLVGHLLYGGAVGLVYQFLERKRKGWAMLDPRLREREARRHRQVGSPAPAVWLLDLGMVLIVVGLLASGAGAADVADDDAFGGSDPGGTEDATEGLPYQVNEVTAATALPQGPPPPGPPPEPLEQAAGPNAYPAVRRHRLHACLP